MLGSTILRPPSVLLLGHLRQHTQAAAWTNFREGNRARSRCVRESILRAFGVRLDSVCADLPPLDLPRDSLGLAMLVSKETERARGLTSQSVAVARATATKVYSPSYGAHSAWVLPKYLGPT